MTCNACTEATANPWTSGAYMAECPSCQARQFAHSPQAKDALLGHPDALQGAMRTIWTTPEKYRQGRIETYRWMKLIDEARSKA